MCDGTIEQVSSAAVTVIVPGRDVEPYVAESLDSLRAQTRTDWSAVLVDDGSTDRTTELFAQAAADDPRFQLVRHEAPRGLGAARNSGLDRVRTPFVAFLDADDVFVPTALERLVGTIAETGSDFTVGAYVRLRPDADGSYSPGTVQPWVAAATDPARRRTTLSAHPAASGNIVAWSKVSRIEFWRRHRMRFPEGALYEDQLVAQRMYTRARAFDVIPDVVVHWRARADGSSITQRTDSLTVLREYLTALTGGLAVLDKTEHRAAARERVRLILDMDTPPLVGIGTTHPDPAYRRRLGAFVRQMLARAEVEGLTLDPANGPLLMSARLW